MKVWEIRDTFGLDQLHLSERDEPRPGPGEVLLRMRACSLNYRDLLMIRGQYDPRQALPLVPLSDGVGEVVELGAGVTRVRTGDRVAPIFAQRWLSGPPDKVATRSTLGGPLDGTLAEYAVFHEDGVVHVPEQLSDAEASTLPCAGVTAWSALVTLGGLRLGDSVLTLGTGGVSVFAVQIAQTLGARVITTSSRDEKLARVRALGASETVNYVTDPSWGKTVRAMTGGVGVDHVIEVGGGRTLAQSLRAVRPGGTVSLIGILSGVAADLNLLPILMNQVRVQGVLVGHRDSFEALNRAVTAHAIRPVVDRVFPFEDAKAALDYLASGAHFGKVVIEM